MSTDIGKETKPKELNHSFDVRQCNAMILFFMVQSCVTQGQTVLRNVLLDLFHHFANIIEWPYTIQDGTGQCQSWPLDAMKTQQSGDVCGGWQLEMWPRVLGTPLHEGVWGSAFVT